MLKKLFFLSSLAFSLIALGGCHYLAKRGCKSGKCDKSQHYSHSKKGCCGKKSWKKNKKKGCCGKRGWKKNKKKACCGAGDLAGHALVKSVTGGKVKGEVFFEAAEERHKVKVKGSFFGLKPNQSFGFHVHEFGNCEDKALMAGGHLNPWGGSHGSARSEERHLGDLGNLKSDKEGQAHYSEEVHGKVKKFLGRSVIVHAGPDDLKSQPTGNAGKRIACGIIGAAMSSDEEKTEEKPADKMKEHQH